MADEPGGSSDERPNCADPRTEPQETESDPRGSDAPGDSQAPITSSLGKVVSDTIYRVRASTRKAIENLGLWKRWKWYRDFKKSGSPAILQSHDRDENAKGRLPDNERVQVPAIWVAELYTPSTISGLFDGISALGWEYGRSRDESVSKWMRDVRHGLTAGWISLGIVTRLDTGIFCERTAALPQGVNASLPILMSITPSLTMFVAAFILSDEYANKLDLPLRKEYATRVIRDPRFRHRELIQHILWNGKRPPRLRKRIYDPDLLRREASRACLKSMEQECVDWIRRRLPGGFASLGTVPFPTAVLLVTDETQPFTEEARKIRAFEGLSINLSWEAFESTEWPHGRMIISHSWDGDRARLVFACRRRDAFPDYADGNDNRTIAHHADQLIRGLLSRWALTCLLDGYHHKLAVLRDKTAGKRTYWPVRDLKELRSLTRTALYDIGSSAGEVEDFTRWDKAYRHDVMEMRRKPPRESPSLIGELKASQRNRAQQIQRESALLQSTLLVGTEVSQTISNIRIQRLVILLTVISISIAIWAVLQTN